MVSFGRNSLAPCALGCTAYSGGSMGKPAVAAYAHHTCKESAYLKYREG